MEKNELTNTIHATLCPRAVLIAYTYEGNNNKYFLEQRSIDARGRMGEGHPVTVEFMNELVRNYSETYSGTPHGRLPSNLLYADTRKGSERYVWYNPPGKRRMYFVSGLGIENAEYNLPGIIYEAGDTRLDVYAYKEDRPGMETALYAAPLFNVTGSSVCLGSARIEKPKELTYVNLLEYWEKKFWLTEFSHLGGHGNPTKSNLVLVTKAARGKPFDLKELKPLKNLKLKDILK
ncbi:PRTRC system protein B [Bacteroides sp. AN502]|uniref:prokaryotic E2 ligase family D protein n=1 Tax=Bacteroides ndongoniae TaxID=1903262 RepID=UPI0008D95E6C|nr:prokaryotic E2 ligase family D protein [Bacteroides ndongoniae]MBV8039611.1 PRTRC system protein B [Caecibacteroides pullorum]MDC6280208.1 prokaryotic E2 ligase family D protein [Caecibacteroides pullorum]